MDENNIYILSFARHAIHGPELADQQRDSNLSGLNSDMKHMNTMTLLTRIKENKPIRSNKINSTSTSLTAQQENELASFGIIKLINILLALRNSHTTIETEVAVSGIYHQYIEERIALKTHFLARSIFSNISSVCV